MHCAPLSFEKERPARPEPAEHIVHARHDRNELGLCGAFKVGAAIAERCLETAILVEEDARRHKTGPGEIICEQLWCLGVFSKVQHLRYPL